MGHERSPADSIMRFLHGIEHVVARRNLLEEAVFVALHEQLPSRPTLSVCHGRKAHFCAELSEFPYGEDKRVNFHKSMI